MKTPPIVTLVALFLGALSLSAFADTPQQFKHDADPASVGADPKAIAKMDALLQSFVDKQKLSCVTGFVAKKGTVVYQRSFGWKDVENHVPATPDDYYVLFSQTKAITTVAFMTLVEQGLVKIDDPVSKYFPGIPDRVVTAVHPDGTYDSRPVKTPMTFVHLMTHTSGLGAGLVKDLRKALHAPDEAPAGFGGPALRETPAGQHSGGGNYGSKYLEEEMLALSRYPLGSDPGTQWNYHISVNMLGYLIERISGKPLREYVREKVLLPLGMTRTDWYYGPEARDRFVKPYSSTDGKLSPGSTLYSDGTFSSQQTYAEGAIGLNGPIEDYAKFCQMLLNKGEFNGHRILRPETVELMTRINRLPPDSGAEKNFQFGLGFELYREKKPVIAVSDSAFAWGGMLGTQYIIDPENDLVALFYINMYKAEPLYPKFLEQAYRFFPTVLPPNTIRAKTEGAVVVVEKGGTGPYPAIATEDAALPGMTIYRPGDLKPFEGAHKLPILLWGNGACANTTQEHRNFLSEIASHGYLVVAIGLLDPSAQRDDSSRSPTCACQLLSSLDLIIAKSKSEGSLYQERLDTSKIAAMGMSCGGLQAIEISSDPRITTSVICNSGVLPGPTGMKGMPNVTKDALAKYHGPVLYLMGGPTDIAYKNAMDDYQRVNHVPIAITNLDVGHGGTYSQPHGGEFTRVALAWLDWQLKGDTSKARLFLGKELSQGSKWSVETKNFSTP